MNHTELAVIINSYNRLSLLKDSLTSLVATLNYIALQSTVIIFDANSTDGSVEWLERFIVDKPTVNLHLIHATREEPDSFSYGVNKASQFAIDTFPDLKYIFLYETDNFIASPQPLQSAIDLLNESNAFAACGFTVKKHDGSEAGDGASLPGLLSFVLGQQFSYLLKLNHSRPQWRNTPWGETTFAEVIYTSPLLIKKASWQKVGGFDYNKFPFSECDIDLAYRIKKAGEKMIVLKTDQVIHDNRTVKSSWSSTRTMSFYQARFIYFRKHFGIGIHLLKPVLFLMHLSEMGLLAFLWLFRKREKDAVIVRWNLMRLVFNGYKK